MIVRRFSVVRLTHPGDEARKAIPEHDATLVTKGTLTGVLDRLETKDLIRRTHVADDRRCTKIRLTSKGETLFRRTFADHAAFLRPYFERALTQKEADQAKLLLTRIRESFQQRAKQG